MQIRAFQLSDYHSVAELFHETLSEKCCEETMGAFARQLSWDSELIMVATVADLVVGVLVGTIDYQNGYVYRVVVHSDNQRKGVGKALVEAMKIRFHQRKVRKMFIAGDKHNEGLRPFYEALGVSAVDFVSPSKPLSIVAG